MIIFFRGFGWLVLILIAGCDLGANLLCNAQLGDKYWDAHKWPLAAALGAAGVLSLLLGLALKSRGNRDAFFFIPVIFWGPILIVAGGVVYALDFFKH
ncbi:MAG TPA: hypothetical protein VG733_18930 [Chthoniobacteraceae bacterium]|nr:hypothetical protein [Chthoniobacteraceae bacterium]